MDLIALSLAQDPVTLSLEVIREYGPLVGGAFVVVGFLGITVRLLFNRLEKAHESAIASLQEAHTKETERLIEGRAIQVRLISEARDREVALLTAELGRALETSKIWQQQSERLADRYEEVAQVAADLSERAFGPRRKQVR